VGQQGSEGVHEEKTGEEREKIERRERRTGSFILRR